MSNHLLVLLKLVYGLYNYIKIIIVMPSLFQFFSLFREELEKEGAHDIDKSVTSGFQKWFEKLISEKAVGVSDHLCALSCSHSSTYHNYKISLSTL